MLLPVGLFARDGEDSSIPLTDSESGADIHPGAQQGNPAVAFIIGVSIVLLASILNAGGLNLTKLDHVRLICCLISPTLRILKGNELGANERGSKSIAQEGLAETIMVVGNDIVHVRC